MNLSKPQRVAILAALVGVSGGCALVYQMVWLREFRLVFGGATPAAATVLAVFMGGLGAGGAWFGRRAERTNNALGLYAVIELSLSVAVLITPWLLQGVRMLYMLTGGVVALGSTRAVLLQILLSVIVLFVPCFLMGGTLPLAVKWAETDDDSQRGSTGLFYGLNALGAVAGVVVSTFWLLEALGTRGTLYLAALINAGIGAVAWKMASRAGLALTESSAVGLPPESEVPGPVIPPFAVAAGQVYGAAFVTGFVFFLTELVWYRMSAPLLGGSTYNFAIILALALAGIGSGGLFYRVWFAGRAGTASPGVFGLVSAVQAFWLVLPYALGDRVAVLAIQANQLRILGFGGQIAGWTLIAAILVFLPSVLAGIQFPLLVGLLGRGRAQVGTHLGSAYAWNTAGAITGSLLGGFFLLPTLTAPGCWRLAAWLTLALSAAALGQAFRRTSYRIVGPGLLIAVLAGLMLLGSIGPTGAWRHSPIGYGRTESVPSSPSQIQTWMHSNRWRTRHEFEGRESSVGLLSLDGYAFFVNGKSDGAALADAPTQVMLGLVGAMLHPKPRTACVVGLGTGSSAGWLADVRGMERVDVVEIEPGMGVLARDYFAPVNRDVMRKQNVRVISGDAREVLLVKGAAYDLIVSEPSNPYRAGISSLYTREYYDAVKGRLAPDGIFSQWVQGYSIDTPTVQLAYATLCSVFPYVETWITKPSDLLFVCHRQLPSYSLQQIRQRVAQAPFNEALLRAWKTDSAEGVLAHHIASPALARHVARMENRVNTDDRNLMEYGFARALMQQQNFTVSDILLVALGGGAERPAHLRDQLDPNRLAEERLLILAASLEPIAVPPGMVGDAGSRVEAIAAYAGGDLERTLRLWRGEPRGPMAQLILLEALSQAGAMEQARPLIERLREAWPVEVHFAEAHLAARRGSVTGAVEHLKAAFTAHRTHPWVRDRVTKSGLNLAVQLGKSSPEVASILFELVAQPFCLTDQDISRIETMALLARNLSPQHRVRAVDAWGKWPRWTRGALEFRRDAYAAADDPRRADAQTDLDTFLLDVGRPFSETMSPQRLRK